MGWSSLLRIRNSAELQRFWHLSGTAVPPRPFP
jgi:hypothetical protein